MSYKPCGYFRVSSTDTAENKLAVRKYRQMLLDEGIAENAVFYDFASGGSADRANYQKMLSAIGRGRYNLVVVPVQSRLNRSVLNSALLIDRLAKYNTKLKICGSTKIIDPTDSTDKLYYHLNAVLDESKLAEASANSRSNHEYLRRNKMVHTVPFGYTIARGKPKLDTEPYLCLLPLKPESELLENKKYEIGNRKLNALPPISYLLPPTSKEDLTRTPAQILRELIDTIFQTQSIPATIRVMRDRYGLPEFIPGQLRHRETKQFDFKCDPLFEHRKQMKFTLFGVKGLIDNPLLQGDLCYFRLDRDRPSEIYPNQYPEAAIVTRTEFKQLQALKTRPWKQTSQRDRFPYAGLIYCHHCKQRLKSRNGWKRKDGIRKKRYYCPNKTKGCVGPSISQAEIERFVTAELTLNCQQIALLAADDSGEGDSPEVKQLKQQLGQLEQIGNNDAISKAIADIKNQIAQKQKEEILGEAARADNLQLLESVFADPLYWQTLSNTEKWQINHQLIKRIEIGLSAESCQVVELQLLTASR